MKLLTKGFAWQIVVSSAIAVCVLALFGQQSVRADQIPAGWEASNMKPVGYTDMGGRGGAFKMTIKHVGDHWYLYTGHLWHRGWSIVDVTDPANPKYLKFIPGPENTWTIQMEMHDNLMITALQKFTPAWGADPEKPNDEGAILWDISDPVNPKQISQWKTGSTGVHRIGYPGGKYASLPANMPGYKGQILLFLDVSDPKNPKEAGRWWLPGQKTGETPVGVVGGFHGPALISPDGKTAYAGYGFSVVILDISDISQPKLIGRVDMSPFKGVHDVLPIPGKPLLLAHSEAIAGDSPSSTPCDEPLAFTGLIDIKDPTKPRLMSLFPTPVPPKDAPYKDFCDKGGRFGPHNTNLEYHLPDVEKTENLVYVTYFNAGLRIFNIENPHLPTEVGWFIPPTPTKRAGPVPAGTLVTQTEDVLVDTRGYIYITDKQWGVFILRYTGPGEPTPTAH